MTVIAVFNQKGGVGKTTTTLNLLAALTRSGQRSIAVDLDPQAHLTLSMGVRPPAPGESISAFFRGEKTLSDLLRNLPGGVRLIPSHMDLSKVDALFGKSVSITTRLRQGLQQSFAQEEAPTLIDCCPMLGVLSLNAVIAADRVLIPVSSDFLSLQGVHRLDAALSVLEGPLKRSITRKVVLTRFDSRRKLSFDIFDKLKEHFGDALCNTRIAENVSLAESPAHGKDVFDYAPHSQGAKDYQALAEELQAAGFFAPRGR
jgi:chromosome partitioning protein